ncbi:hypothetical protein B7494_g686 [Chlorociboria aeruginascens]|nr:hypothetical protein B7494_g686 [Chlorociboria aeruginascens]
MKTFTISAFAALLAGLTTAAPTIESRQFEAQITFTGAGGASYTLSVPTDASVFPITDPLAVSFISSLGGATCGFTGIDGSSTVVIGAQTVVVAPPQAQVSGSCLAF